MAINNTQIKISKYSANGNDFVIFHQFKRDNFSDLAIKICDRHNGIGADGLIVLIPHEKYDFEWLFYNSDGSEATMCGNGTRATAHYAYQNSLADSKMQFLTGAGVISAEIMLKESPNLVKTELTPPKILQKNITEFDKNWWLIDTGVIHLTSFVDDLESFNLDEMRFLRQKYNANVNLASEKDGKIFIRTFERGVEDETLACGTGMASAFYRAFEEKIINEKESFVYPKSGDTLFLEKNDKTILFQGEVTHTFEAIFFI
jgi:diaminopimelate epimerase